MVSGNIISENYTAPPSINFLFYYLFRKVYINSKVLHIRAKQKTVTSAKLYKTIPSTNLYNLCIEICGEHRYILEICMCGKNFLIDAQNYNDVHILMVMSMLKNLLDADIIVCDCVTLIFEKFAYLHLPY